MPAIRRILHPTDLSETSRAAFRLACALARDSGAELRVLHVYPPPVGGAEAVDRHRDDELETTLKQKIRDAAPAADAPGVAVDYWIEEGAPAEVIVEVAKVCDLVVMGTHGRTGLARVLLGSVAERVVREAPCPVATVRPSVQVPPESAGA
jgi:nucleotide-binding universal stress UspA family protein